LVENIKCFPKETVDFDPSKIHDAIPFFSDLPDSTPKPPAESRLNSHPAVCHPLKSREFTQLTPEISLIRSFPPTFSSELGGHGNLFHLAVKM
jgi:hypothetical protein